jgi:hypothetical protein
MLLERMTQMEPVVDGVVVAAAPSFATHISGAFQVDDDLHRGAFGDADQVGDLAESEIRGAGDGEQDVGMVREERPGAVRSILGHISSIARV